MRGQDTELDYHSVHEDVVAGQLTTRFISSKNQMADVLIKPLSKNQFIFLCNMLRVHSMPLASLGRMIAISLYYSKQIMYNNCRIKSNSHKDQINYKKQIMCSNCKTKSNGHKEQIATNQTRKAFENIIVDLL